MTMKKNIKLVKKNRKDRMIAKHSLSTLKCYNFFPRPAKILKCQHTLHTFASPTMPTHKPKLAKECNCANAPIKRVNCYFNTLEA